MSNNAFFAMMARMKYIDRWALMRNTAKESLSAHSLETAMLAHALCLLSNRRYGTQYDAERAALLAIYHDCGEIITGDLPTPVKYFNPDIKNAYRAVESSARSDLLNMLPEELRADYEAVLAPAGEDAALKPILKAADKLSALIKCIEERRMGNTEFTSAEESTRRSLQQLQLPVVQDFLQEFIPAYSLTLDELNGEKSDD